MSADNAWRIAMEAAMAEAEEVEINPIPSLWNFGTTSRPVDRAEWKGRKEGAQDVKVLLASLPIPPAFEAAFRAAVEAEAEEVVRVLRGLVGRYEEIVMHEELGRSLDDHDLARARAILSRLESKGEPK